MDLVIFVGLPGAGKSTFYARRFAATHVLVSKDLMRSARSKSRRQARELEAALAAGRSVVVDNTNASAAERGEALAIGQLHGARAVAYWFPPDVEGCLARNEQREGRARVPRVGLFATLARMTPPLKAEGFAEVWKVTVKDGAFEVVEASEAAGDAGAQRDEAVRPGEPGGPQGGGGDG